MASRPARKAKLPALVGRDDRLRHSLVTLAERRPVEQEPDRLVGAAGQPAFTNGWTTLAGYGRPRFWKASDGWVHLAGVAYWPATSGSFAGAIFNLPTGYRPPFEQIDARLLTQIVTAANLASYGTPALNVYVEVIAEGRANAGNLRIVASAAIAAERAVLLDGLSFRST